MDVLHIAGRLKAAPGTANTGADPGEGKDKQGWRSPKGRGGPRRDGSRDPSHRELLEGSQGCAPPDLSAAVKGSVRLFPKKGRPSASQLPLLSALELY